MILNELYKIVTDTQKEVTEAKMALERVSETLRRTEMSYLNVVGQFFYGRFTKKPIIETYKGYSVKIANVGMEPPVYDFDFYMENPNYVLHHLLLYLVETKNGRKKVNGNKFIVPLRSFNFITEIDMNLTKDPESWFVIDAVEP